MSKIMVISAISLIGLYFIGVCNQSYAVGGSKESEKVSKSEKSLELVDLLMIKRENDRSILNEISYDYILGLLLEFGEGKISIDELDSEFKKRVAICKDKEQQAIKKDAGEVEKLLAATTKEVWEKYERLIIEDKKLLQSKEVNKSDLQAKYKRLAIKWSNRRYGFEEKSESLNPTGQTSKKISEDRGGI